MSGVIMGRIDQDLKVFLSSTSEDLQDYRAVARHVILDMGWNPRMMEHFGALPSPTVAACREILQECDLLVLIVAHRRGWVPSVEQGGNGNDSITALELEFARKHKLPALAFIANEAWPGNLWEDDGTARAWMKGFRSEINLPARFFNYEAPTVKDSERLPAFRAELRSALVSYRERLDRERATTTAGPDRGQIESAAAALRSGACIPFVGYGVYGSGALSSTELVKALGEPESDEVSLATAAEYREHFLRSRPAFLQHLEVLFGAGTDADVPAHNLIVAIKPPMIVSTTSDLVLERRLEAAGRPVLILCHVIRSQGGTHDGKILLFRGTADSSPQLCLADKVELGDTSKLQVIYKPLGSPLLHPQLDQELEIDTVVMTEGDHLVLLTRLQSQSTRVPMAFSRQFQRYPLVFLGYPMDVWHFRLVAEVFRSIGVTKNSGTSLAVRKPASTMEELSWKWLGVDLLRMDPNEFARGIATA